MNPHNSRHCETPLYLSLSIEKKRIFNNPSHIKFPFTSHSAGFWNQDDS